MLLVRISHPPTNARNRMPRRLERCHVQSSSRCPNIRKLFLGTPLCIHTHILDASQKYASPHLYPRTLNEQPVVGSQTTNRTNHGTVPAAILYTGCYWTQRIRRDQHSPFVGRSADQIALKHARGLWDDRQNHPWPGCQAPAALYSKIPPGRFRDSRKPNGSRRRAHARRLGHVLVRGERQGLPWQEKAYCALRKGWWFP